VENTAPRWQNVRTAREAPSREKEARSDLGDLALHAELAQHETTRPEDRTDTDDPRDRDDENRLELVTAVRERRGEDLRRRRRSGNRKHPLSWSSRDWPLEQRQEQETDRGTRADAEEDRLREEVNVGTHSEAAPFMRPQNQPVTIRRTITATTKIASSATTTPREQKDEGRSLKEDQDPEADQDRPVLSIIEEARLNHQSRPRRMPYRTTTACDQEDGS